MSLNKGVKLKFHALLAKTSKNLQIFKNTSILPVNPCSGTPKNSTKNTYSAFQIRKSQEIPEFYLQRSSNYKRFRKGRASEARPLRRIGLSQCRTTALSLQKATWSNFTALLNDIKRASITAAVSLRHQTGALYSALE